ncbi:diphthine synthase [Halovenus salina]|uniref:Diphthine synthase n=1 Tax=Halovenus salina TaxID=1510225 RepID=A0ABD5VYZ7_9EURY|nr:diphthine synthase [Halovenus salina]
MLSFIGLGLYDERSITLRGRDVLADADTAFAEFYTSQLVGTAVEQLESTHDIDIEVRERAGIEQRPEPILAAAEERHAAMLTAGDTMISTTHVDLRTRAHERGIETQVIHGTTAQTAASSLTGLQNYRFGKATTLPFEETHGGVPDSVIETVQANRERDLHTLVYLDIDAEDDRFMTGDTAASLLGDELDDPLGVVVTQAGSDDPTVRADRLSILAEESFGDPLHLLVVPAACHPLEKESLQTFGGAPESAFE